MSKNAHAPKRPCLYKVRFNSCLIKMFPWAIHKAGPICRFGFILFCWPTSARVEIVKIPRGLPYYCEGFRTHNLPRFKEHSKCGRVQRIQNPPLGPPLVSRPVNSLQALVSGLLVVVWPNLWHHQNTDWRLIASFLKICNLGNFKGTDHYPLLSWWWGNGGSKF